MKAPATMAQTSHAQLQASIRLAVASSDHGKLVDLCQLAQEAGLQEDNPCFEVGLAQMNSSALKTDHLRMDLILAVANLVLPTFLTREARVQAARRMTQLLALAADLDYAARGQEQPGLSDVITRLRSAAGDLDAPGDLAAASVIVNAAIRGIQDHLQQQALPAGQDSFARDRKRCAACNLLDCTTSRDRMLLAARGARTI